MENPDTIPMIGIVGVCASGKSTLLKALTRAGYNCRHIAQEHSYVKDMWKRMVHPDILIFLEVTFEKTLERKNLNWTREEYETQLFRLRNAYENANIRISTDHLKPEDLFTLAVEEIHRLINH